MTNNAHRPLIFVLLLAAAALFVYHQPLVTRVQAQTSDTDQTVKKIAFSFDDAPRGAGAFLDKDKRPQILIDALKKAGVSQAVFFVNTGRISPSDGDALTIARYVDAGHVIANHTANHPNLSKTSADLFLLDIDEAENWLRGKKGYRPWLRYPFLNQGGADKVKRDTVRAGLKARGMRHGYATIDGSDWYMEELTKQAVKSGQVIDRDALRALYIETHLQSANFADNLSRRTSEAQGKTGAPVQMLLLHETDLAALYIGDLVDALRKDGWQIVTADAAYADPIATSQPDTAYANGTLTEMLAWEKGIGPPRWYERNDTAIAKKLFDTRVLHKDTQPE